AESMKVLVELAMMVGAGCQALAGERAESVSALDRVTYAVDGAESSHGKDRAMWRPDAAGPQGPMQVSEKAAIDVGGGDRFDVTQTGRLAALTWPSCIDAMAIGRCHL